MSSQRSIPTIDRINKLPDSLIFHILSFLPTKQSAATSVLSKRWKPLWLSVLTLDFDDQNFADFATFRHFVYSVMLSRNIMLPLLSFSLKCGNSSCVNRHDINRFINSVVQRGVQNLNLDMSPKLVHFELPTSVFSCINLTVLKLNNLQINYSSHVNFPLLKTLHLYSIYFHKSRDDFLILRLLNGCPLLEDLKTENLLMRSSVYGVRDYDVLIKLVRANISNLQLNIPLDWIRNAKFLRLTLKRPYCYQVPTFPNLTHMEIVFQLRNTNWFGKWKWKWLTEVLQNCPNLQNLTIHEDTSYVNEIGDDDWMDPPIVPECLSSHLKTCSLIAFKGVKCELQFAEYILKNAKALHTMKISASPVDSNIKLQMLMKLSLCPRGSTTCKLSFD